MPFRPLLITRASACRNSRRTLHRGRSDGRRIGGVSGIEGQTDFDPRILPPKLAYPCLHPFHSLAEIEVIIPPLRETIFFLWWLIGEHG